MTRRRVFVQSGKLIEHVRLKSKKMNTYNPRAENQRILSAEVSPSQLRHFTFTKFVDPLIMSQIWVLRICGEWVSGKLAVDWNFSKCDVDKRRRRPTSGKRPRFAINLLISVSIPLLSWTSSSLYTTHRQSIKLLITRDTKSEKLIKLILIGKQKNVTFDCDITVRFVYF